MNIEDTNMEINDAEFDRWLGRELNESMVEPPENFTEIVMAAIEKPPLNGSIDTFWVVILISISLTMTALVGVIYLFPSELFQHVNISSFLTVSNSGIKNIVQYGTLLLLGVAVFYVIDNFLEHRFRCRKPIPL
ncbi:MAG TPA: hypothetical protein P5200_02115 [Tenuifilaceae bacterium]|nr:hypothetical protein [Tenuifilaceae bacterium]HRX67136.1 hypothetical protein [Tenuifilaceae bacterium]